MMKQSIKKLLILLLLSINIPIILIPTSILLPDFYHILVSRNEDNISLMYIMEFLLIYCSSIGVIFYSLLKLGLNKKYLLLLSFQYIWFLFYFLSEHILFWINQFEKDVSNIAQTFWITCLLLIDYCILKKLFKNKLLEGLTLLCLITEVIYLFKI